MKFEICVTTTYEVEADTVEEALYKYNALGEGKETDWTEITEVLDEDGYCCWP